MSRPVPQSPSLTRLKRLSVPAWLLLQALGVEGQRMRLQVAGLPADARLVDLAIDTFSGTQRVELMIASDSFEEVAVGQSVPFLPTNYEPESWPAAAVAEVPR